MKKRIESKLYDTDSSEFIADVGAGMMLYRKRTRDREWFAVVGEDIMPLDDRNARAFLGENTYIEKKGDPNVTYMRVDRKSHDVIAKLAKEDNVPIIEEVRRIVSGYLAWKGSQIDPHIKKLRVCRNIAREREWFLQIGQYIEPVEDEQARALLGENVYHEKPPESKRIMIGVDRETHEKIARAAKKNGLPISEFMKKWADGTL